MTDCAPTLIPSPSRNEAASDVPRLRSAGHVLWVSILAVGLTGCGTLRNAAWLRSDESERLVAEAHEAQAEGELDRAERLLALALRKNPDNVGTRRALATLLADSDRPQAAIQELEQILAENPAESTVRLELAELHLSQGDLVEASRHAEQLLIQDRQNVRGMLLQADIAERRGQPADALEHYHRVLQVDPEHVTALLATARIHLAEGRPQRAAPILRSVAQSPRATADQITEVRRALSQAYADAGRWPDAYNTLEEVCQCDWSTADDHFRLAQAASRTGDLVQCRHSLITALDLDPEHAAARTLLHELEVDPTEVAQGTFSQIVPTAHEEDATARSPIRSATSAP